jgi:hypothetical protein
MVKTKYSQFLFSSEVLHMIRLLGVFIILQAYDVGSVGKVNSVLHAR